MDDEGPRLTPRHWGVLGVINLSPGRDPSPQEIADELHFPVEEVEQLLSDLRAQGYLKASG